MTAYEIYEAAFDSACDNAEYTAGYVSEYAEGAMNIVITSEVAEKITACAVEFRDNGNGTNDFYHIVEKPLKSIEL